MRVRNIPSYRVYRLLVWWASPFTREEGSGVMRIRELFQCLCNTCGYTLCVKPHSWRSDSWLVRARAGDSPNKLLNKKIWHLVGQPARLGWPHHIWSDVARSDWAALLDSAVQLAYRHDTRPFLSCEGAGPPDYTNSKIWPSAIFCSFQLRDQPNTWIATQKYRLLHFLINWPAISLIVDSSFSVVNSHSRTQHVHCIVCKSIYCCRYHVNLRIWCICNRHLF